MSRTTILRLVAVFAGIVSAVLWPSLRWTLFVDRCLDAGGSVDYAGRHCSTTTQFAPPASHWWFEAPSVLEVLVGLAVVILITGLVLGRARKRDTATPVI